METLQIILLFGVFLLLSVLMFFRKIPALLALPVMAFLIPLISGVNIIDVLTLVIGQGSTRLAQAYTIAIYGSMLSILMQKTGVAERFIKIGAELSGDKPFAIALVMLILVTLLFTTLGGLGAIIMVSTVVLPILISAGVSPLTTTGIFLIGLSMGGIFNVGNWALYTNVLKLDFNEVRTFALVMFVLTFLIALGYIVIQLYKDGHDINFIKIGIYAVLVGSVCAGVYYGFQLLPGNIRENTLYTVSAVGTGLKYIIGTLILALFALVFYRAFAGKNEEVHWSAFFTPVIPLILILLFNFDIIAGFIAGLLYGFAATYRKKGMNTLVRSILEGGAVVMPAVALMLGIGMLLNAVMGPGSLANTVYKDGWPVLNLLQPVMKGVVPTNAISYILIFTLAAPLALYRGPLNVWGMGYGIAAIFLASGMAPGAIMGLLISVGQIQGISDPTNTQNVWLANEMRVDVQKILWNTLPYTWLAALLGLIASSLLFY